MDDTMSISQFSFDIKPDIVYNVQVKTLCWPGNRFQIVVSLIFLKHPGSMDWGIIIQEKDIDCQGNVLQLQARCCLLR